MAQHPPAARRAVLRRLKAGEHPTALVKDAQAIQDPGHAAAAMLALAVDDRLPAKKAAQLVRESAKGLATIDRPGRVGEAWSEALAACDGVRRGPEMETALRQLHERGSAAVIALPDGQWVADAIEGIAPRIDAAHLPALMRRALQNPGAELAPAKALLQRDTQLAELVKQTATAEVAARLLSKVEGSSALRAAWAIGDVAGRREALRVMIWNESDPSVLESISRNAWEHDPADAVAVHTMVAARCDRLNLDPTMHFDAARKGVDRISGAEQSKARRKLSAALERAGLPGLDGDAAPIVEAEPEPEPSPVEARQRHVLALVNGYTGAFGPTHVRAIARAAPLCIAFDLDLALVGFPVNDEETVVDVVRAETNVGEDGDYMARLLAQERLLCLPLAHGVPPFWPGTPVATTPHPEAGKETALEGVKGPICLVIGLGKQGLPKRLLNVVDHHHELTGQGISMETATAMGILADRLGRLPV